MAYPHRWSPISYKSSAGQRKHIDQRPMLYRWTTPPTDIVTEVHMCVQQDISYSALLVPTNRNFAKCVAVADGSAVNMSESSQSSQGILVNSCCTYCSEITAGVLCHIITFHMSRRRREMYCGHAHRVCVCVCLSVCPQLHAHTIVWTRM